MSLKFFAASHTAQCCMCNDAIKLADLISISLDSCTVPEYFRLSMRMELLHSDPTALLRVSCKMSQLFFETFPHTKLNSFCIFSNSPLRICSCA